MKYISSKNNQVHIYYAMNSSYLYISHTVTLASLLATYVPFLARKKQQFQNECKHQVKEKKSSQLASLMDGLSFENFMCSIGKIF